MRARLSLRLSFAGMVALSSVSFGQQVTVTGRIELSSKATNRSPDLSGAVVWLTEIGNSVKTPAEPGRRPLQLLQKRKNFSPHVLVVPAGAPVEFPNQDPFFHNVFSLFEGKRFDLGLYEAGSTRTITFDHAGISYIFCNIHPEMSAVVIALNTPYYGISDRDGMIVIPNVPPGNYEMDVWHERVLPETLNNISRKILISETSHSLGVLLLTEQRNLSHFHKNKYGQDYDIPTAVPGYTRP